MRDLLRSLAETVWPVDPAARANRATLDDYLKPLLILLIALLAGPDILAAVELTTLLDLLGATMFLMVFWISYKVLGLLALKCLQKALVPEESVVLIKMPEPFTVLIGMSLVAVRGLLIFLLCITPYLFISGAVG